MPITIEFTAQIKKSAGVGKLVVPVDTTTTLISLLNHISSGRSNEFVRLILKEDGTIQPSLLVIHNGMQIEHDNNLQLHDKDTITLLSPLSGG